MIEYFKVDAPINFPAMCICGSQKGPLVDTAIEKRDYGHIYLCRMCVTRSARALGMVKGDEMVRLQNAADELDQATKEIESRDALLKTMTETAADRDRRIAAQDEYIDTLRAKEAERRHLAELIASNARELTAA